MARLLLLLLVAAGIYLFIRWFTRQPARLRWQILAIALATILLLLVVTGRAHWIAAVFAALLPFLRGLLSLAGNWPLIRRLLDRFGGGVTAGQGPAGGQKSTVESQYLRMSLDHDSGEINGKVLAGQYAGKMLDQLDLQALLQLLQECQHDEESVTLLQANLDRMYADSWQQERGSQSNRQEAGSGSQMSSTEALEILGLAGDASDNDIVDAHRRLMQKLHPDRGGSAYLAAKINLAKDVLLRSSNG